LECTGLTEVLCFFGLASDPIDKGAEELADEDEGKASAEDTTSAGGQVEDSPGHVAVDIAEGNPDRELKGQQQHEDGPGKDKPGLTDGQASDLEALLALSQALTGLDKLDGWSDLKTHRDVSRCKGITVDKSGRVTGLVFQNKGLSGGHVQCKGHETACCSTDQLSLCAPHQGVCLLNWES
jgi:hypothetical protein